MLTFVAKQATRTMNFDFTLLYTGLARLDDTLEYHDVCSNFSRIIFIKDGYGQLYCGNEQHTLMPGRMYLIPPLLTHSMQLYGPSYHYYAMFADQSMHLYDHFHLHRYNLEIAATTALKATLRYIVRQVPQFALTDLAPVSYDSPHKNMKRINEFRHLPASDQMSLNGLLHVLLSQFMDREAPPANVNDIRISKAMWTINRDLTQVPSLDELADKACLNKNTFIRLFRKQTGYTPADYIIRRRILQAQILFSSGLHSVKEVAFQVGYDNVSYFGRTFKRIVGISPLHFIMQNK